MKTWYDKRGHECYGYARGSIKNALENSIGFAETSQYYYHSAHDEGGVSVYRQNKKTNKTERVYYRAFGD